MKFTQAQIDYAHEEWAREWINFLGIFLRFSGVIIHKDRRFHPWDIDVNSLYAHQINGGLKKGEINIIAAGVGVGKSIISKG